MKFSQTVRLSFKQFLVLVVGVAAVFALVAGVYVANTWPRFISNARWEKALEEQGAFQSGSILFFGDSQVALWKMAPSFGSLPIRNRGRSGDTTFRARTRFEQVLAETKPEFAVLLIGVNDLAGNGSPEAVVSNITAMVHYAEARDVRTVLCSLLPIGSNWERPISTASILKVNQLLHKTAEERRLSFADFYSLLADEDGAFRESYTSDGLHPSPAGYAVMTRALFPLLGEVRK